MSVDGKVTMKDMAQGQTYMLPKGLTHIEEGVVGYPQRIFLVPIDVGVLSIASDDEQAKDMPLAGGQVLFLPGGHSRRIVSMAGTLRAAVIELK